MGKYQLMLALSVLLLALIPGVVLAQEGGSPSVIITGSLSVAAPLALFAFVLAEIFKRIKKLDPYRDYIPAVLVVTTMAIGAGYYTLRSGDWLRGLEAGLTAAALAVFGYEFVTRSILRQGAARDEQDADTDAAIADLQYQLAQARDAPEVTAEMVDAGYSEPKCFTHRGIDYVTYHAPSGTYYASSVSSVRPFFVFADTEAGACAKAELEIDARFDAGDGVT